MFHPSTVQVNFSSSARHSLFSHDLVKQPKELTEQGMSTIEKIKFTSLTCFLAWRRMRDDLVDILSDHKTRRLATEQEETAHQRYSKLERIYAHLSTADLREPFPPLGDILNHQLLEYLIWETPTEDDLTEGFFSDKLSEILPEFVQQWRLMKVQELVDIMQRTGLPNATESDLYLATTIFCCTQCNQNMHFPSMFYHGCCLRAEFQPPQSRLQTYQRKRAVNSLKGFGHLVQSVSV